MNFSLQKKPLLILIVTIFILISTACSNSYNNPDTPEEVWGDLVEQEGGYVWDTLSKDQQELINYPKLDKDKVYWVSNGKSYHSIEWCYTLSKSSNIMSGTLEEALENGKADPCSKCVGD